MRARTAPWCRGNRPPRRRPSPTRAAASLGSEYLELADLARFLLRVDRVVRVDGVRREPPPGDERREEDERGRDRIGDAHGVDEGLARQLDQRGALLSRQRAREIERSPDRIVQRSGR